MMRELLIKLKFRVQLLNYGFYYYLNLLYFGPHNRKTKKSYLNFVKFLSKKSEANINTRESPADSIVNESSTNSLTANDSLVENKDTNLLVNIEEKNVLIEKNNKIDVLVVKENKKKKGLKYYFYVVFFGTAHERYFQNLRDLSEKSKKEDILWRERKKKRYQVYRGVRYRLYEWLYGENFEERFKIWERSKEELRKLDLKEKAEYKERKLLLKEKGFKYRLYVKLHTLIF